MKPYIKERTLQIAKHIVQTEDTIRATARVFNLSKSTVHSDLSKRLKGCDRGMYNKVQEVLEKNFGEKHIRGGIATKKKYERMQEERRI